jgi:hypothetical protein
MDSAMKWLKNEDGTAWIMFVDDAIDNTVLEGIFKVRHVKSLKILLSILAVLSYTAMVGFGLVIYLHPESVSLLMDLGVALLIGCVCLRIMNRLKFNRRESDSTH